MNTFKVDQKIRYTNGSAHVYTGIVVEVHPHSLVVPPMHFKQVVEIEQIGKNKSGKPIHTSRTRHVPA